MELRVPVLTTALAACRVCFPWQDIEALRHVAELLSEYLDTFSSQWTVKRACRAGLPRRALDYLAAHGKDSDWGPSDYDTLSIIASAVSLGHLHVLQWINECHPDCPGWNVGNYGVKLLDQAARSGQLAILQWLHANRSEGCSTRAMDWAASSGHVDVVRWLHEHRSEGCTRLAMNDAARFGCLDVVRFLHEHRSEGWTKKAMDLACAGGHLAVVKYLHENRREGCTGEAMRQAAANGHLEVVQWLHANRSEGHPGAALRNAARAGQIAVAAWLAEVVRGQRRGEDRIRDAAQEALRTGRIHVSTLLEQKLKRPRLG